MAFEQFYTLNENSNIAKNFRLKKATERAIYGDNRNKEAAKYIKSVAQTAEEITNAHSDIARKCEQYVTQHFDMFKRSTLFKTLQHNRFTSNGKVITIPSNIRRREFDINTFTTPTIEWYVGKANIIALGNEDGTLTSDPYGYVYLHDPTIMYLDASRLNTDMRDDMPLTAVHELAHCIQFAIRRYPVLTKGGHDALWEAIMISMHQTPMQYADVGVDR